MAIERTVKHQAPRYEASIDQDGTSVTAAIVGDQVRLRRHGGRNSLWIPEAEWPALLLLAQQVTDALAEKAQVTGQVPSLPWERQDEVSPYVEPIEP